MRRRMIWVFLAGTLVGVSLSGLYKHFVTDQIMDGGGGMENPDVILPLDGDHTCVDNDALWPVLEGTWESADGRRQAVIGEESGIALSVDGETVLTSSLYFTYLQPARSPGRSSGSTAMRSSPRTGRRSAKSRISATTHGTAAAARWCSS